MLGELSELSARELEDHVMKQRKVYVRQLNSPSNEVVKKDWLAISCGDWGRVLAKKVRRRTKATRWVC